MLRAPCRLAEDTWQGGSDERLAIADVRASADQLHQLEIAKVGTFLFRVERRAIGRIAYNDDASTPVLTPFSGRVTRLIAKIGDVVKRGDPLFEIDSPEVVLPQNDFIAAIAAQNKAAHSSIWRRSSRSGSANLYEGKAAPLKEFQQAQADLTAAQNDMRAADTALDAVRNRLIILGLTRSRSRRCRRSAKSSVHADLFADRRHRHRPQGRTGPVCAQRFHRGAVHDRQPLHDVAQGADPENDIPAIKVGQHAEVTITALPGRVFAARITAIEASADAATRRLVVRSEIPNPDGALKSEMFASFTIVTGENELSTAVPSSALIREGENVERLGGSGAAAVQASCRRDRDRAVCHGANSQRPQAWRTDRRPWRDLCRQRVAAMNNAAYGCDRAA